MPVIRRWAQGFAALLAVLVSLASGQAAVAQNVAGSENKIQASLLADGPAIPGRPLTLAIRFRPVSHEWHGYWKNPGDAGYGMQLTWDLPAGWTAGEPQYPVPKTLLISGLMNHIYEGEYAVLVPITVAQGAVLSGPAQIGLRAQWLACTDTICVPQSGTMELPVPVGSGKAADDGQFARWRAEIPALLDSRARFSIEGKMLRLAIPVPQSLTLSDPHIFIANTDLIQYAADQKFGRSGDLLVVELPLSGSASSPDEIEAILAFGGGQGVRFLADPGAVPAVPTSGGMSSPPPPFVWLLLAALAGGLILNVMPCVFPILSLKALSLARAGGSEAEARKEGAAYSAGVILACVALGAIMLALRAAGEQVGWAFQLQQPAVVVALLVLAVAITANFAGLFDLPAVPITRSGQPASAFATGLLAAIAATPCTGPFMAAAVGAALLLPSAQALLLFAVLGLGLALPFLLIGFIPGVRALLPKPGAWMDLFRKAMAIPMGLTALGLIWLVSRLGGKGFALMAMILVIGIFIALAATGRLQKAGKMAWPAFGLIAAPFVIFGAFALPASYNETAPPAAESLLDPIAYDADALAKARAAGRPVFMWFTADWCLTCKVNERVAIDREVTRYAFTRAGVVAMRGDWTRRDPAITAYLTDHGAAGVPLYVWYAPGEEAQILPQVLTPDALITLAQAAVKVPQPVRRQGGTRRSAQ